MTGLILTNENEEIIFGEKATRIIDSIEEILGNNGKIRVRFTTIPQDYYSIECDDKNLEEKLSKELQENSLTDLLEASSSNNSAWLSGVLEVNNGSSKWFFNYQERFNRYGTNWEYNNFDELVSPKRSAIARFFSRHYEEDKFPLWVEELIRKDEEIENTVRTASMEEVFKDSLKAYTILPRREKAEKVIEELWELVNNDYDNSLLESRELLPFVIDEELKYKLRKEIHYVLENPVITKVANNFSKIFSQADLLSLYNSEWIKEQGLSFYTDCLDDLDEFLVDVLKLLVRIQSMQRFPQLRGKIK